MSIPGSEDPLRHRPTATSLDLAEGGGHVAPSASTRAKNRPLSAVSKELLVGLGVTFVGKNLLCLMGGCSDDLRSMSPSYKVAIVVAAVGLAILSFLAVPKVLEQNLTGKRALTGKKVFAALSSADGVGLAALVLYVTHVSKGAQGLAFIFDGLFAMYVTKFLFEACMKLKNRSESSDAIPV